MIQSTTVEMEVTKGDVGKMTIQQSPRQLKHQNHRNVASMNLDVTWDIALRGSMFAMVFLIVIKVCVERLIREKFAVFSII